MSAPKRPIRPVLVWFLVGVVAAASLVAWLYLARPQQAVLEVGSHSYSLEIADEAAEQTRGLGGRAELSPGRGMLFIFKDDAPRCFWMKDMRFALDIVWTDAAKRVVHIAAEVQPSSYPEAFCSDQPARYVIELPAGEAARAGMSEGQELRF